MQNKTRPTAPHLRYNTNNGPDGGGGGGGGYGGGGGSSNNTQGGVRSSQQQDKSNQPIQLHHPAAANHMMSAYHPARPPSQPPPSQGGIGPPGYIHYAHNPTLSRPPPRQHQIPAGRPAFIPVYEGAVNTICTTPFYQTMPVLPMYGATAGGTEGGRAPPQASFAAWSNPGQPGPVTIINTQPPSAQPNPQQPQQPQPSYQQSQFSYIPSRVNHPYPSGGGGGGGGTGGVVQQPPPAAVIVERQLQSQQQQQLHGKQKSTRKNRIPIINPDTGLEVTVEESMAQGGAAGGSGQIQHIGHQHTQPVHHTTSNQVSSGDSARIAADFAAKVAQAALDTRVPQEETQVNGPGNNEVLDERNVEEQQQQVSTTERHEAAPPVVQTKRPPGPTPVVSAQAEGTTYDIQSIRNSSNRVEMRSGENSPARSKVGNQPIPSLLQGTQVSQVVQVPVQVLQQQQPHVHIPQLIHHQLSGQPPHQPNDLLIHHTLPQQPVVHPQQQVVHQPQPVVQQVVHQQQPVVQQVVHQQQSVVHQQSPVVHQQQSVVHQQQSVVHQQPSVVHQQQPVVHQQQPVVHQQQPVVHQQQPVVHQQQPVVHQQPPVAHQQPPVAHQQPSVVLSQQPVHPQHPIHQQVVHPQQPVHQQQPAHPQPVVQQQVAQQQNQDTPKQQRQQRREPQPPAAQPQEKKPVQVAKPPLPQVEEKEEKGRSTPQREASPLIATPAPPPPKENTPAPDPPKVEVKVVAEIKKEKSVEAKDQPEEPKQPSPVETPKLSPTPTPVPQKPKTAFAEGFSLSQMKMTAKAAQSAVQLQAAQTLTAAQQETTETTEPTQVKSMSRSKQKGKHKMREMNQKGVDKEGTDMDAFVDTKNNENNNRNNNDNATSQQQDHTNNNQINNQTGEEDKEESLVQAKNEENSKLNAVRSDNESAEQDNDKASSEEESGPEDDESSQLSNKQLALKYQYKEDQWSPLNPEGKKIYDRDFLMKLRDDPLSAKKPDIMTDVEIFVKEGQQGAQPGLRRMNSHSQHGGYTGFSSGSMRGSNNGALLPDFFNRSMSQRMPPKRNSSQGGGGRGPGGGGNRSLKLMYNNSMSMKDDYKWVQSENAWKPTKMTRGGDNKSKEERETEELYKKVRGILNKLTPQKFGTLVTQFQNLPINSLLRLQGTIGLVFEKAVDEPAFSVSYAHLCKVLGKLEVNEKQPSGAEKQNQENQQPAKQSVHFRKLLITKCQQEFETNKKLELDFEKRQQDINENPDPEKRKELQILFNEEERKIRMKSVGLVTFIGELFKLKMLTANIMHGCIKQLLGKIDEESLECLCKLLTTIGKEFEEQINSSKNNNQSGIQEFNEYFQQMTKLSRKHEGSKVSSRVRFMLQDVIELRMNNWVPRRDENKPKTMAQIQAEVERESERQAAMLAAQPLRHQNQNLNQDRGGNRRNNPRGGGNVQSEDGWNTVGSNKYRSNNYAAEASKIQGLKALAGQELMDKNTRSEMTLGPSNSFRSWGAGSGARSAAPTSTNAFSILDDEKRLPLGRIQRDEKESDKSKLLQNISSFIRSTSQNDRDGRENRGRGQSGGSPSPSLSGPQRKPIQMLPRSQAAGSEDNSRESTPALTPQTSTDTSRTETQPPVEKAEPAQPKEKLDEEHLKQYATTLIKEYIDNQNIQESIESYKELFTEDSGVFILTCLDFLLEQSKRDKRFKVSTLLGLLARNNMFTSQSLVSEIGCIFESINDVAVDVPHIWQYMGEVFGDIMCLGGLDFSHLKECIRRIPPKVKNKMDQTMKELFRILSLEKGPVWIKSVWDSCNVHIKDFISDDTMADKFLIEHAYLEGKEVEASDSNLPYDRIQDKLLSFLKDNKENFDTICGWLTSNVGHRTRDPKFIRQLTEAIIKSSLVNNDNKVQLDNKLLKRCIALLKRYIDNIEELELSCLYSVQYLVVITLESPFGMLVEIFNELYESATISAEGFNKWKCEENFVENWQREGRGVAIASLKNFFQILHEDAQDDQDDEPS